MTISAVYALVEFLTTYRVLCSSRSGFSALAPGECLHRGFEACLLQRRDVMQLSGKGLWNADASFSFLFKYERSRR